MIEQAHAAVGARQNEVAAEIAAGLLLRSVRQKAREVGVGGRAIEQHEGRVPFFRNDAVSTLLRRQIVAEADEAIDALRRAGFVDGGADAAAIDVEPGAAKLPAFVGHPTQ